jgi:glucose/arabinose dehydrogenase
MALPLRFPMALLALFAMTACASPSSAPGETASVAAPAPAETPADPPAPETTPPAAEEPAMTCQADKGQWAIGQIADEALVAKVKADTTSDRVRVIRPGMAVTMDYREDRVNLDVDADNRVTGVRCT